VLDDFLLVLAEAKKKLGSDLGDHGTTAYHQK
jgi:hypothetical protein